MNDFQKHLDRFGHAVYNLDFVNPVPADEPAPLLDTVRFYLQGHQSVRAAGAVGCPEGAGNECGGGPAGRGTPVDISAIRWAQDVAPVREDALADVGLGWPQMRRMLAELGRRLAVAGVIERTEDVYWLRHEELRNQTAVQSGQPGRDLRGQVARRKQIWRGQRRATPPQLLPKGVWFYGMDKMMPAVSEDQTGDVIKGIGASAGQVTAAARVLGGPQDFSQMQPGEVLVASITTPAWTSLFAMASAVVTDIGGRSATAPSSPANTGSRPCSVPPLRRDGSLAENESGSMATSAR